MVQKSNHDWYPYDDRREFNDVTMSNRLLIQLTHDCSDCQYDRDSLEAWFGTGLIPPFGPTGGYFKDYHHNHGLTSRNSSARFLTLNMQPNPGVHRTSTSWTQFDFGVH